MVRRTSQVRCWHTRVPPNEKCSPRGKRMRRHRTREETHSHRPGSTPECCGKIDLGDAGRSEPRRPFVASAEILAGLGSAQAQAKTAGGNGRIEGRPSGFGGFKKEMPPVRSLRPADSQLRGSAPAPRRPRAAVVGRHRHRVR